MVIKKICWTLFVLSILFPVFCSAAKENKSKVQTVDEIGFLRISEMRKYKADDEIFFGIKMNRSAYYKISGSDQESVIKAGYLNEGLNIIGLPLNLIKGKNSGIFFLFLKEKNIFIIKRINFNIKNSVNFETDKDWDDSGTIHDINRHELTVSEVIKEDPLSSPGAGPVDPVAGNYPAMSQGIPVLPVIFFLAKKILSGKRKTRTKIVEFFKTAKFFILEKEKGENGKTKNLKISIAISDL